MGFVEQENTRRAWASAHLTAAFHRSLTAGDSATVRFYKQLLLVKLSRPETGLHSKSFGPRPAILTVMALTGRTIF